MYTKNSRSSLHHCHRARLRDKFDRNPESLADHELLELLLFFARSRVNTNPIAHRLIDTFGSLQAVFDASPEEQTAVDGVGTQTAALLQLLPAILNRCQRNRQTESKLRFDTAEKLGSFFVAYFAGVTEERFAVALLDNRGAMIDCRTLACGNVSDCRIDMQQLARYVYSRHPASIVIAHNHPGGVAMPSREDLTATVCIRNFLETGGLTLREHILVAGAAYRPILRDAARFSVGRYDPEAPQD